MRRRSTSRDDSGGEEDGAVGEHRRRRRVVPATDNKAETTRPRRHGAIHGARGPRDMPHAHAQQRAPAQAQG
eukprot:3028575-Pleurochrysis_carterae.AAC.1